MAQLTVVYWRDIPAQVIVKKGRESAKVQLTERFECLHLGSRERAK